MATHARSVRGRETAPLRRSSASLRQSDAASPRAASTRSETARGAQATVPFATIRPVAPGQQPAASAGSIRRLNGILADAMFLYALYKKHHWLVTGPTFIELHRLFDLHAGEQLRIVDLVAERVQALGGIAVGDPRHAAELTILERPPDGAEPPPAMLDRLIDAHTRVVARVREAIGASAVSGDWGTNDLLVGDVLRVNERQAWFVAVQQAGDWGSATPALPAGRGIPPAEVPSATADEGGRS